ncbi:MAG: cupin domain-containing protein [Xanthomonadales bacterium]|jgi:quercetin dioxygenase-like cupin family protein|nr:cupin domain-containing protein [Xanthomonadales bacterium]
MSLENRLVRYADLKPCYTAFIDTRSPGSDKKENFTVIGPGVAENPEQHVHISIPHGFNIGGARQPPGCLNSQHSHLTNEVFVVHTGSWAFLSGVDGSDGKVVLGEGDVISLPTDVFRGFENVGDDLGYLYAVLGGDDPGRVLWAPQVFDLAQDHGLVLMEDGSLVDVAAGESPPAGLNPMPKTTPAQVAEHRVVDSCMLENIIIRRKDFQWTTKTALSVFAGVEEAALLGPANEKEAIPEGMLGWPHEFVLRALRLAPGSGVPAHSRAEEEVLFLQQGRLTVSIDGESIELGPGDTFTTPIGVARSFSNQGDRSSIVYITRRNDQPEAPEFI